MSLRPGRTPQSSPYRKTQLTSDAAIIVELIRNQPQSKESLMETSKVKERMLYRTLAFLQEQKIVKYEEEMYSLWNFDLVEKVIEAAFVKFTDKKITFIGLGLIA